MKYDAFDLIIEKTRYGAEIESYPLVENGQAKMVPYSHDKKRQSTKNINDEIFTDLPKITIYFNYPLKNPVAFHYESPNGFTYKDFYRCVYEGYTTIYKEEEDPGYVSGMLNRANSEGPYGIWGHYLGDLCLEGFDEKTPGYYTLSIGS